jgi:Kef-type K+ transport system membrane component KefB
MPEFLSFFIILLAGLFLSVIGRRLHLPWVVALILAGIIIGPQGFGIFEVNSTFEFLGQIGLVFLMFVAGLETNLESLKAIGKKVSVIALANGALPFLAGAAIALSFGYDISASLLVGIIFISSSISIVVPILQSNGLLKTSLGKTIVGNAIILDIGSLVLLSIVLQKTNQLATLPLPLFYLIFFAAIIILIKIIPKIRNVFIPRDPHYKDLFEREVRVVFAILLGTVALFEILGLHPIVAGFFAGLVLSDSVKSEIFKEKLHTISYGLFIPVFFVVVGAKTNLLIFKEATDVLVLAAAIVGGSIIFKFISGWLGAKIAGFTAGSASFIAGATIPQLSTTLAAAFAAQSLGLLDEALSTSIIVLSVVSTFVGAMVVGFFAKRADSVVKLDNTKYK